MQLRTTLFCTTTLSLLSMATAQAAARQPAGEVGPTPAVALANRGELRFTMGGTTVRRWTEGGVAHAAMSRNGGRSWITLEQPDDRLHFVFAQFDPIEAPLQLDAAMGAPTGTRLFLVQFHTQVLGEYRSAVQGAGAEILHFMPASALFLRCDPNVAAGLRQLACVRWVGELPNACKLDATLRQFMHSDAGAMEMNLILSAKSDRQVCAEQVQGLGGQVTELCEQSVMIRAKLTPAQLQALLSLDTVTWADPVTETGYDMDNARIQFGANYVETQGGYLGTGVRAEITEAFEETHPDFLGRVVVRGTNGVDTHGHCTAGCVAGNGSGNFSARGMMPLCDLIEGRYTSAGNHASQAIGSTNPALPWKSMVATSSWGSTQIPNYSSVSQGMDDGLFQADLTRTQSQSNTGNQNSRPEAWAKNIISCGGVKHLNDSNPANDNWTGGGSIGPAADGRLKPDICGFYDSVLTSDRSGTAGYNTTAGVAGNYYSSFGGTSAATPMVCGTLGLIHEMFTDGLFDNVLPMPATPANRFANKPHMTTAKALLCNTASQYPFSGTAADLTRTHVGWGYPGLQRLYDNRNNIVVLDEYDTLQVGESRTYWVWVEPGTPEFRATMVYADPAAQANAAITLINNANLKVTRLADGMFWWGNNGLNAGNFSTSGGVANNRDNIECVYLSNPTPGLYHVTVEATSIVQDAKLETPQIDMDYALVIHPVGGGYHDDTGMTLDLVSTGPGNLTFTAANVPAAGWTEGYTSLSFDTSRGLGFGNFFGLELDTLTVVLWNTAAAPDNPFHFTNAGAGSYPNTSFVFPDAGLISFLAGIKVDGVMTLFDGSGDVVAQSNVDRITLQ